MKLELLEKGKQYKYKDLCEAFGVEPKTGNAKKAQFKTFEQYLVLEKNGTWFTVVDFHEQVQERNDGRGKSEATQKALAESDKGRKPKFNYDDELQLMILLYLAKRTYAENLETGGKPNVKYFYNVGMSSLFIQSGLCSNFYHDVLCKDGYYLLGSKRDVEKGIALYTKSEFKEAFRDFYKHMQNDTRTALENLRKRKVLDYYEIKSWFDGQEWHPCNDEEMSLIIEAREDAIDWWNETHKKQIATTYDLYNQWALTPKEKDEVFEWMNKRLAETLSEDFICYTSTFKIFCSERAINRHLTKIGYGELIDNKELIDKKINEVKQKNLDLQIERTLNKTRNKHIEALEKFYEQEPTVVERHGYGKRAIIEKQVDNMPYSPLADEQIYENAKELLKKGIFGVSQEEARAINKMINSRKK